MGDKEKVFELLEVGPCASFRLLCTSRVFKKFIKPKWSVFLRVQKDISLAFGGYYRNRLHFLKRLDLG